LTVRITHFLPAGRWPCMTDRSGLFDR
jgi:hypothetical protein